MGSKKWTGLPMTGIVTKAMRSLAAIGGAIAVMAAAPAQAEDNNLVAEYERPAAPGSAIGSGKGEDAQFNQLFANWERLDEPTTPSAAVAVSVPSRMPLDGARISSNYGTRIHPVLGGRRGHKGVDLAAPTGTPVYATADGLVSRANWFSSYGKYISIEHGAALQTRFAHLSEIVVSEGEKVKKGDLIGYVGSTGRSTGPHLHYEVRVDGVAVDPSPYMVPGATHRQFALAGSQGASGGE